MNAGANQTGLSSEVEGIDYIKQIVIHWSSIKIVPGSHDDIYIILP
jgi:hypothetical protein